jgi:predicted PurR-regulated permease PerM
MRRGEFVADLLLVLKPWCLVHLYRFLPFFLPFFLSFFFSFFLPPVVMRRGEFVADLLLLKPEAVVASTYERGLYTPDPLLTPS